MIEKKLIYPKLRVCSSAADAEVMVDGKKVLMFASNNYLGLANNSQIKQAVKEAIDKYGIGSEGSRILSGNYDVVEDLEKKIASFKKTEDAIVFPCGYSTNAGVIPAVMNLFGTNPLSLLFSRKGIILSDELNHASIIDGCRMAKKAEVIVYKHKDIFDLENKLKHCQNRRKLIITDTIFSMDGDIAPLDKIVDLAEKYNSSVMVDEAHANGIMGERGSGLVEEMHLEGRVDIIMGTLSKALGSIGGYVAGSKELIKFLRVASRSYMFSTAFPPALAAGLLKAIDIIEKDNNLRERLWENTHYLRNKLQVAGFDTLQSQTQIIPVLVGDRDKAILMSDLLFEKNIFVSCSRWPAVPQGQSRIRISVIATHTKEQIDYLVNACQEIGKELKII